MRLIIEQGADVVAELSRRGESTSVSRVMFGEIRDCSIDLLVNGLARVTGDCCLASIVCGGEEALLELI